MGRKRQRSRAALTDDDEQLVVTVDESESAQDLGGAESQADEETEKRKKELDVWDAFKEEHHEGLFQRSNTILDACTHTDFSCQFSNSCRCRCIASLS